MRFNCQRAHASGLFACCICFSWYDERKWPRCRWFFSHTWTIYAYPSPLSFKKAFIVVSANGWHFVLNSRLTTEPLYRCSSSCRNRGGSAVAGCISSFGWKQGGLVDTLPYTCDSWNGARKPLKNISSMHTGNSFLPQQLPQKGKGRRVTKQVCQSCPHLIGRIKVDH